jgi:tripartite ATP-independent transporter DctM subunit
MDPTILGVIGFLVLFFLIFVSGMSIGFAMGLVGFAGIAVVGSMDAAFGSLATIPYRTVAFYAMSVIPMFILMGEFAFFSGIVSSAYRVLNKWVGHFPGGLAMATIGGCAGFAACCGSSVACATVMVPVSVPEMKKFNYAPQLSLGTIAAGSALGILIPPSTPFVVYGILTEQSIGRLLIAGVLPGVLLATMFVITIAVLVRFRPDIGPPAEKFKWADRIRSLKDVWAVTLLAAVIMGGIWGGLFTPEEAGAVGALATFVIALFHKRLTFEKVLRSLDNTVRATAMIFAIMIGAMIFNGFLAITGLPFLLSTFIANLPFPPMAILVCILLLYLVLGCIMDPLAMVILTVPILLPTLTNLGFDLIWFGVLLTVMTEMALITPPIGVTVFAIAGMVREDNIPMYTVFRGVLPFVLTMAIGIIILIVFPPISTYLPSVMR